MELREKNSRGAVPHRVLRAPVAGQRDAEDICKDAEDVASVGDGRGRVEIKIGRDVVEEAVRREAVSAAAITHHYARGAFFIVVCTAPLVAGEASPLPAAGAPVADGLCVETKTVAQRGHRGCANATNRHRAKRVELTTS